MALSAAMVWEVRTTGLNANAGGFKTGATGTDRSQQDAAQATLTVASVVHTTTTQINVSVVDFTVSAADVGNILKISGGTATAGRYEITAVDVPNNRWTLDRSAGTAAQTVTGAMGGAVLSPGEIAGALVNGNTVFIKAGTYSLTSASNNVAGGCVNISVMAIFVGYSSTRTSSTTDTKPVIEWNVSNATFILTAGYFINIEFDGNLQTSSRACNGVSVAMARCVFRDFTNSAASNGVLLHCYITGCTTASAVVGTATTAFNCEATANAVAGFACRCLNCLSYANTTGFIGAASLVEYCQGCVAYGNTGDGFSFTSSAPGVQAVLVSCIAEANSAFGFVGSTAGRKVLINCATFSNTSGATSGVLEIINLITLSGTAFNNAGAGDFSLNNTSGQGALLRAVAYPTTFLGGLTANYRDIGAAQHQDSGGGGMLVHPGLAGGMRG